MNTPKIAIVHDFLETMGGAERVVLELAKIYPDAPIYTLTFNPTLNQFFDSKRIRTSYLQSFRFIPQRFFIGVYPRAIESFDFSQFDVVISSSNSFAKNILVSGATKHISYIHSPMRFAWDAAHTHLANQAHRTPLGRAFGLVELIASSIISKLRIWDKLGADRVDVFIANSKNVAQRISKYYRRDSTVVYPPVDIDKITATPTHQNYFLVVSRLVSYKKIELAVQACKELNLPLLILGEGPEMDNLKRIAGSHTQLLGWVSDQDKFNYLQNCRALIFPGEEDLGIVPIEAMAAGKPVIAYNKGGLTETVIDGKTGIFFNNQTVADVKQAIEKFIKISDSPRGAEEIPFDYKFIRQHAEQFSSQVFDEKIKALVASVS
jgi:glycosyltransferase involved in cell wall biosynthesis